MAGGDRSERRKLIAEGIAGGLSEESAAAQADKILGERDVVIIDEHGRRHWQGPSDLLLAPSEQTRVLILCTGNSARSQMAEGLLRHLGAGRLEVASAGTKPSTVRPEAIAVMQERGIDISRHWSKHVNDFAGQPFDYVISVCDAAKETCPDFPAPTQRVHWSFPDPAAVLGTEDERLAAFRSVRDALETSLAGFVAGLAGVA